MIVGEALAIDNVCSVEHFEYISNFHVFLSLYVQKKSINDWNYH